MDTKVPESFVNWLTKWNRDFILRAHGFESDDVESLRPEPIQTKRIEFVELAKNAIIFGLNPYRDSKKNGIEGYEGASRRAKYKQCILGEDCIWPGCKAILHTHDEAYSQNAGGKFRENLARLIPTEFHSRIAFANWCPWPSRNGDSFHGFFTSLRPKRGEVLQPYQCGMELIQLIKPRVVITLGNRTYAETLLQKLRESGCKFEYLCLHHPSARRNNLTNRYLDETVRNVSRCLRNVAERSARL